MPETNIDKKQDQLEKISARKELIDIFKNKFVSKPDQMLDEDWDKVLAYISSVESHLDEIIGYIAKNSIPDQYFNIIYQDVVSISDLFRTIISEENINSSLFDVNSIERHKFNWEFFGNLNFLEKNMVIVGANGCGKTTLAKKLKDTIASTGRQGTVISASRIMLLSAGSIPVLVDASQRFSQMKIKYNDFKDNNNETASEFGIVLQYLISNYIELSTIPGEDISKKDKNNTFFFRVINFWNKLY